MVGNHSSKPWSLNPSRQVRTCALFYVHPNAPSVSPGRAGAVSGMSPALLLSGADSAVQTHSCYRLSACQCAAGGQTPFNGICLFYCAKEQSPGGFWFYPDVCVVQVSTESLNHRSSWAMTDGDTALAAPCACAEGREMLHGQGQGEERLVHT